jgi:opacity protein-like surface antigen
MRNFLSFSGFISAVWIFSAVSIVNAQPINSTNNISANDNYRPYFFFEGGSNLFANGQGNATTVIPQVGAPVGNGNTENDSISLGNTMQFAVGGGFKFPLLIKTNWLQDNALEFSMGYFDSKIAGSRIETQNTTIMPPYSIVIANTNYNYKISNLLLMANYVVDFKPIFSKFVPFAALGIGLAHTESNSYSQTIIPVQTQFIDSVTTNNNSKTSFAYNLGFGMKANLSHNLQVALGYRYVDAGSIGLGGVVGIANGDEGSSTYNLAVPSIDNKFNEIYLRLIYQI